MKKLMGIAVALLLLPALALADMHCDRFRVIQFHRGIALLLLEKLEIFATRRDREHVLAINEEIGRIAGLHATGSGLRAEIALAQASASDTALAQAKETTHE